VRDVLHLADEAVQLAAWEQLAALEDDPDQAAIDAYLRGLAPEGMVYVPAGALLMGTTEEEIAFLLENTTDETARMVLETEKPQHQVWLPGYYIGRYPVTNRAFAAFVAATGYRTEAETGDGGWVIRAERGWHQMEGADWQHPDGPESDIEDKQDHPVVQVSWNDARAFCHWAGVRLPTEAEWEKAAGWDPVDKRKRRYPWGDAWDAGRCHINRPDAGTAAVGAYSPRGDSAYGCADMAGNVYQWCSTRWGTDPDRPDYGYPYDGADGREDPAGGAEMRRIVRGTSWHTVVEPVAQWARCAFRDRNFPGSWNYFRGFRATAPRRLSSDAGS
jgi:formylglycine-generating enzyme required for sulfatase activity